MNSYFHLCIMKFVFIVVIVEENVLKFSFHNISIFFIISFFSEMQIIQFNISYLLNFIPTVPLLFYKSKVLESIQFLLKKFLSRFQSTPLEGDGWFRSEWFSVGESE